MYGDCRRLQAFWRATEQHLSCRAGSFVNTDSSVAGVEGVVASEGDQDLLARLRAAGRGNTALRPAPHNVLQVRHIPCSKQRKVVRLMSPLWSLLAYVLRRSREFTFTHPLSIPDTRILRVKISSVMFIRHPCDSLMVQRIISLESHPQGHPHTPLPATMYMGVLAQERFSEPSGDGYTVPRPVST